MEKCPSKSANGLACDRDDNWISHTSLTHRNTEAQRDWYLDPQDRVRWGVVGPVKRGKPNGAGVKSEDPILCGHKEPVEGCAGCGEAVEDQTDSG